MYKNVLDLFYKMFTQLKFQSLFNPGEKKTDVCTAQMLFGSHSMSFSFVQGSMKSAQTGLRIADNQSYLRLWLLHRKAGQDFSLVSMSF